MDQAHSVEKVHDPDIGSLGTIIRFLVSWQLEVDTLQNFFFTDPVSEALRTGIRVSILIQPVSCVFIFSSMGGARSWPPATAAASALTGRW